MRGEGQLVSCAAWVGGDDELVSAPVDIEPDADLERFRAEVAEFLDTAPTDAIREAGRKTTSAFAPFDETMAWQRILHARGWAAPDRPVEHGGTGWSVQQRYVYADEYQKRGLPPLLPNALRMIGPLLMELGTAEQKARYLPRILSAEDSWTQGYSEPDAGSDLASLSCSAVADGDDYVINGSKIWTTLAHRSNRMFMLVRTSRAGKKQQGITFLLLDRTDLPGMVIRPIVGLDGVPEQCEVFFDDVRAPQSGRVGAENEGWSVAKQLLRHERGVSADSPVLRRRIEVVRRAAAAAPSAFGDTLADDAVFQRDLGELEADVASYEHAEKLALGGHPIAADPAFPSMNKVLGSELTHADDDAGGRARRVAGPARRPGGGRRDRGPRRRSRPRRDALLPQQPGHHDLRRHQRGAARPHRAHAADLRDGHGLQLHRGADDAARLPVALPAARLRVRRPAGDRALDAGKLGYLKARSTLLYTTALAEAGRAGPRDIAILKAQAGRLGRSLGEAAIQTHGGVGMTDELPVGHLHKRILGVEAMFGATDHHLRTVGAAPA